jgi:hypothetical protein
VATRKTFDRQEAPELAEFVAIVEPLIRQHGGTSEFPMLSVHGDHRDHAQK